MSQITPRHSIKVVSQRTGLSPHLIRAWERRYATVRPLRSGGNQRLYGEDDVQRLLLLRRATEAGHPIRTVAQLPLEQLQAMLHQAGGDGRLSNGRSVSPPLNFGGTRPGKQGPELVGEALQAIQAMDAAELERVLEQGAVSLGQVALLTQVISPLVERVGDGWQAGELKVAHEHLASAVIRTFLGNAARPFAVHASAPLLIATTPNGQLHEIGAALAAAAATSHGWRVTYLGPSLPAEEIASVARQNHARAVALSIVHPADDGYLGLELQRLRRLLPAKTALIVGGRAAPAYANALQAAEAVVCSSLLEFSVTLDQLRQSAN